MKQIQFENDVKMYGIQTGSPCLYCIYMFENDVKMYGIQTQAPTYKTISTFENDVKMYGIQTPLVQSNTPFRLRMM